VDPKELPATGRDDPATPDTTSENRSPFWDSHGTLLVVDDDPAVREVVTSLLERCGLTVLAAADGQSALEVFRRCADEIRLVLLDLVLPDTDGEALFHAMRKIRPGLRAILCSGCLTDEAVERRLRAGWAAIIRKPFRLIPFLQTVRTVLEA
jgi:DNA-binding NtrC family response regulator